jgi:hypothetical protein
MIPKSLHTITALANVARHLIQASPMTYAAASNASKAACIDAAIILGYAHHPDDYGLIDKAAAVIAKGSK